MSTVLPFAGSAPLYPYDLVRDEGQLKDWSISDFRRQVEKRLAVSAAPSKEDARSKKGEVWRWAYPSTDGPAQAGRFWLIYIQSFEKKAPAGLVDAKVEDWIEMETHTRDGVRPNRGEVSEHKASVVDAVMMDTPPKVKLYPVVLDIRANRIYLFDTKEDRRTATLARLGEMLSPVMGSGLRFDPIDLPSVLELSRPQAELPSDLGSQFLRWLVARALAGEVASTQVRKAGGGQEVIHVQPLIKKGIRLKLPGTGEITVKGTEAAAGYASDLVVNTENEEDEATVIAGTFHIAVRYGDAYFGFSVTLNGDGQIRKVFLDDPPKFRSTTDKDGNGPEYDAALADRMGVLRLAGLAVRTLYHAFDDGPLTRQLNDEPKQAQLWPGQALIPVTWEKGTLERPKVDADNSQEKLL